ncbi:MAG: flagellar basal-body rod protein FlgG [Pseudomonadota bacterium]
MRALKIAATGMDAQQTRVEVISNNIANMSTTAYRERRANFSDLHYQQVQTPGSISSNTGTLVATGVQLGLGVRTAEVSMQVGQGAVSQTGGELDVAVEGRGWIEVELPDGGAAYTRDGGFQKTADGLIVTRDGYALAAGITIPEDARRVQINADGQVFAFFDGQVEGQEIGAIELVTFVNEKGLEALGDNLFRATAASGDPAPGAPATDGRGTLRQGYLEQSTVDVVSEITELIEAQRGYEMNSKVVTAADQMLGATVQIR